MRKLVLALAAVAAFGLTLPLTSPAKAEEGKVVIKEGREHHRMHRDRDHRRVVVIKHREHRAEGSIIRTGHHDRDRD